MTTNLSRDVAAAVAFHAELAHLRAIRDAAVALIATDGDGEWEHWAEWQALRDLLPKEPERPAARHLQAVPAVEPVTALWLVEYSTGLEWQPYSEGQPEALAAVVPAGSGLWTWTAWDGPAGPQDGVAASLASAKLACIEALELGREVA